MQQCQVSAYLDVIQVVNVELGDGSAPNCDIDGLGGRGIRLHQHHSQILVNLQIHKLTNSRLCFQARMSDEAQVAPHPRL